MALTAQQFFDTYKDLAIETQAKSGVPASITLAQAGIESGYGKSELAQKANNYFGILTAGYPLWFEDFMWNDSQTLKFRKYKSVYDSFIDHADFLLLNKRYKSLFKDTNYQNWAYGLQAANYAGETDTYAPLILNLIENYNLDKYDVEGDKKMNTVSNYLIRTRYTSYRVLATGIALVILYFIGRKAGFWGKSK